MIYLHVPFCGSFCTYCDFYSEICRDIRAFNDYADAVIAEIRRRREELSMNMSAQDAVNTLYVGGGTPSVLPLDVLSRIVKAVPETGRTGLFEEFTIEVNPEDIVEKGSEYARGLLGLGVNRISMGIQSFEDGILRWMNRRHDARRAVEAFRILRGCGVRNISIDLIFGMPQLTDEIWKDTIEKALELAPEHISAYQLSIEEGSALSVMLADGRYVEASDEQCRHQYDILCQALKGSGYHHYEISNFAKPGFEAVHNSAYWRRVPYIGLGPGAHSLSGNVRSWNGRVLPRRIPDGDLTTYSRSFETLSPEDIRTERLMLSLRTDKGLEATELYSLADRTAIASLLDAGALESHGSRIRIPEDRLFTSDGILRELI